MPPQLAPGQPYVGKQTYVLPDGKRIVLPGNFTKEQIDAAIGGYLDQAAKPPTLGETTQDLYQHIARPVTKAVEYLLSGREPLQDLQDYLVGKGPATPEDRVPPEILSPLAKHIVPQTPLQAGLMAGTMGAGGIAARAGMGALKAAATRVGGGIVGGEIGGQLQGESPGMGGLVGGVGALAGEGTGKAVDLTGRMIANLTGALYKADAKRVAEKLGELVPSLKGAKNADDLRDLVMTGTGKQKLFDRLMAGYDEVKQLIGDRDLYIPSLGGRISFTAARKALTENFRKGFRSVENPSPARIPTATSRDAQTDFFTLINEIRRDLTRLDRSATTVFPAMPTGPTSLGNATPVRPGEVPPMETPTGGFNVGGRARQAFDDARAEFRKGINLIDMLHRANGPMNRLFPSEGTGVGFETQRLQNYMGANEAKLGQRVGKEAFQDFARAPMRGNPVGRGDTEGISLGRLFMRSQGPVSGGAFIERFPTLSIPYYAGAPFQPRPTAQTLLDVMAQRGVAPSLGVTLQPPPE